MGREKKDEELAAHDVAFLLADIVSAGPTITVRPVTWESLGSAGKAVKKRIAEQNIDPDDEDMVVDLYAVSLDKREVAIIDLNYGGGSAGPDPFRFVYVVEDGKYKGYAGMVAS